MRTMSHIFIQCISSITITVYLFASCICAFVYFNQKCQWLISTKPGYNIITKEEHTQTQ